MKQFIKKHRLISITALIILILVVAAIVFQRSYATADGTSGSCKWSIDAQGKMVIEPEEGQTECTLQNQIGSSSASPWFSNRENITSVEVKPGVKANVNASRLFHFLSNATSIDVRNLDTSNTTTMRSMFEDCSSLTSLDVSNFNTSNVTEMNHMFNNCFSLTSLNLGSNFNTSNVTTMRSMFNNCNSLTNLDVSNFNTSNVTTMYYMFWGCKSLSHLDLSNFNLSNVIDVTGMFRRVGEDKNEGAKLILNNTFTGVYSLDDSYRFPYNYYTKEVNGVLDNRLYTLSEMQQEVTSSSTPTTWVPAFQVNYDKGDGDSVSGASPQIYRIGSKINTNGLLGIKNKYDFVNWNDKADGTGTSINKNGTSANSYGDKCAPVGENNVLTLYGQYEKQEEGIATDMDVTRIIKGAPSKVTNEFTYTITPDTNNPASVTGIPSSFKINFNNESSTSGVATKGININFDEAVYTKPGDYKFTVTETGTTDSVTYPLSRDKWEVSISVRYKQSGGSPTTELIVKSVVMKKVGETNKGTGMIFESETKMTNISIFHKVEGNMADIEKYFKIKVTINGETGEEYTISGLDTSGVTYNGTAVTNPTKFVVGQDNYIYLKHNQSVVIGEKNSTRNSTQNEIKSGLTYTIEEDNTGESMLYETYINSSTTNSKNSGNLVTNINAAENDNSIINKYNADTMTGKFLKVLPYIGIVLVATLGIVIMVVRKIRLKEEE